MSEESRAEEQAFLVDLYKYMKDRDTPIERIPFLGFKQSEWFTPVASFIISRTAFIQTAVRRQR